MKKFWQMLVVGTLLTTAYGAASQAAAPDPAVGTWTLNLAKSKYTSGPLPKSMTRTYTATADGMSFSFTGAAADGSTLSGESTYKYDGKDYPVTGSPYFDTLAVKRVNTGTVHSTLKKSGKVVGSSVRSVSAHGRVLTLTTNAKDAKGAPFKDVAVYDKQ